MKRRVARIGPSTLMVSLPSKWCKERDIHKGDEIEVNFGENNSLVIGAEPSEQKPKEITLDLSKFRYYPRHLVGAAYKTGYDQIVAKYFSEKEKRDVESILTYTCLGYSILDETKDTFVIKDLAKIDEKEFVPMLRKYFFLTTEIAANTVELAKTMNRDKLVELVSNRRMSHKYADFCRRVINKNLTIGYGYPSLIYYIIEQAETITRACQNLALCFANVNVDAISLPTGFNIPLKIKMRKINPRIIRFLEKINQQVAMLPILIYSHALEKIDTFTCKTNQLIQEFKKEILSCKKGGEALEWSYFLLILDALRELRGTLMALNF